MTNPAFDVVLLADPDERRGLFAETAQRLGTTSQNIEKDFWVCWTLDLLFNGHLLGGPRLLFKGGTSLSKGYGLISRFSEDIDVTVFRDDLGAAATVDELNKLTLKPRKAKLEDIQARCIAFLNQDLLPHMVAAVNATIERCQLPEDVFRVEIDPADQQTILLYYPAVTPTDLYLTPYVKIESGAKSALDPNSLRTISPYVNDDLPDHDLSVSNVVTVDAERTFWDKVVILHGLRSWYDRRNELKGDGQRVSRHYYDVYKLLNEEVGARAAADLALGRDCVAHALIFFNRPDFDLATAQPGSFKLVPHDGMLEALRRDYNAMSGMIFGNVPDFASIVAAVMELETRLNNIA